MAAHAELILLITGLATAGALVLVVAPVTMMKVVFGQAPTMMIAGDDSAAKASVASIVNEAGWFALDAGDAAAALHLEHMTLLWIKLVRMGGQSEHLTWARLSA